MAIDLKAYLHHAFTVPIYETTLDLNIEKLTKVCNSFRQNNISRSVSNLGGYQANFTSENDEVKRLMKDVETHAQQYAKTYINDEEQNLTNLWLNINGYQCSNFSHRHAGADISGTYYVKTPKNCGTIVFENPAVDILDYYLVSQNITEPSSFLEGGWEFKPSENSLYLFPAWLKHYVNPNENKNEERLSIAFNLKR